MSRPGEIPRFTRAERWVHRGTACLTGVCLITGCVLYIGELAVLVGRRALVEQIHIWAGIAVPVPVLLGWTSRAFRRDIRRLNRFSSVDWEWLRAADRRSGRLPVGKFNAGQKLNASVTAGALLVLLGTGLVMRFANHWPLSWRVGATFTHDWFTAGLALLVLGHLSFALSDPVARTGLRSGSVPRWWARREHRGWVEKELSDLEEPAGGAAGPD